MKRSGVPMGWWFHGPDVIVSPDDTRALKHLGGNEFELYKRVNLRYKTVRTGKMLKSSFYGKDYEMPETRQVPVASDDPLEFEVTGWVSDYESAEDWLSGGIPGLMIPVNTGNAEIFNPFD